MVAQLSTLQGAFFDYVYGEERGHVCIATDTPLKGNFRQTFFEWPVQKKEMVAYVTEASERYNVWYGVHLLDRPERKKRYCKPTNLLWADLDECSPENVTPTPQAIVESSPNRYQALWKLDRLLDPYEAEHLSKRIAFTYQSEGADLSGWDLTQLLRVPFTHNRKPEYINTPQIILHTVEDHLYTLEDFDLLSEVEKEDNELEADMPDWRKLQPAQDVQAKYWPYLQKTAFLSIHTDEPDESTDWSARLWRLLLICFEAGMNQEEVFAVAMEAKCNKYVRDDRPISHLWREILRAKISHQKVEAIVGQYEYITMPELVSKEELEMLPKTLIDDYCEYAETATDASPQYHPLTFFIVLSMLLSSGLKLETSYGTFTPNLWGLILGDSTLTRKTTAMKLGMSFIDEIDQDLILATDASAEGLMSGVSMRPNLVSAFYRDEVGGFLDSIIRKDYMASMPETLTQLYDVPSLLSRKLRKETISVVNPIFIFFGGGIRDKTYSLINEQLIVSGFIPRFLIVSGESDLSQIRTTGPPAASNVDKREKIRIALSDLYREYTRTGEIEIAGQSGVSINVKVEAFLTNEAWERYQKIEYTMLQAASGSAVSHLALPCFERLSRSLLKMSMLIAAIRQEVVNDTIQVEVVDVVMAAKYIQKWGTYTIDLILNSGRSQAQKVVQAVLAAIVRQPDIARGKIMQHYHLTKREMDEIEGTLVDRGQLIVTKAGKASLYKAVIDG